MNRERFELLLDDWALDRLPAADARAFDAALAANAEWAEQAREHRAMLKALADSPPVQAPVGLLAAAMARARSGEDPLAEAGIDLDDLEPGAEVVECMVPISTGPEAAYPTAAVMDVPRRQRSSRRVWQFAAAACLLVGAGITAWTLQPDARMERASLPASSARDAAANESAPMLSMSVLEGEAPTGEPLSGAALADADSPFREDALREALVTGDVREESALQAFDVSELASAAEPMVAAEPAEVADAAKPEERVLGRERKDLFFSADEPPAMAKAARANEAVTRTLAPETEAAPPPPVLAQSAVSATRRQAPAPAAAARPEAPMGGGFGSAVASSPSPSTAGGYAGRAGSAYAVDVTSAEFTEASAVALAASFAPRPITAGPPAPSSPTPIPDADLEHMLVQASQAGGRQASPQAAPGGGLARLALEFDSRADYEAFLVNLRAVPMIAPAPVAIVSNAAGAPTRQPVGGSGTVGNGGAAAMRRSVVDGGVPPRPGLNGRISANALSNAAGAAIGAALSQLARFEIEAYDFQPRRDPRTGAITVQVTARPDR